MKMDGMVAKAMGEVDAVLAFYGLPHDVTNVPGTDSRRVA